MEKVLVHAVPSALSSCGLLHVWVYGSLAFTLAVAFSATSACTHTYSNPQLLSLEQVDGCVKETE